MEDIGYLQLVICTALFIYHYAGLNVFQVVALLTFETEIDCTNCSLVWKTMHIQCIQSSREETLFSRQISMHQICRVQDRYS